MFIRMTLLSAIVYVIAFACALNDLRVSANTQTCSDVDHVSCLAMKAQHPDMCTTDPILATSVCPATCNNCRMSYLSYLSLFILGICKDFENPTHNHYSKKVLEYMGHATEKLSLLKSFDILYYILNQHENLTPWKTPII
jgi:hypothetical protein